MKQTVGLPQNYKYHYIEDVKACEEYDFTTGAEVSDEEDVSTSRSKRKRSVAVSKNCSSGLSTLFKVISGFVNCTLILHQIYIVQSRILISYNCDKYGPHLCINLDQHRIMSCIVVY